MALPSSQPEIDKSPQTRCANCQTVFEVSSDLLASNDTRVRCGECLCIFDALEGLRPRSAEQGERADTAIGASSLPSSEAAALAGLSNDTSALDVTYSDFDLFSEEAELPEVAYFDQTRDTPEFDFDAVELGEDETFNDTLFAHDVTINADVVDGLKQSRHAANLAQIADVDFIADEAPQEKLIFRYQDRAEELPAQALSVDTTASTDEAINAVRTHSVAKSDGTPASGIERATLSSNSWRLPVILTTLLCLLLGSLYLYRNRDNLHNYPLTRPIMLAGCAVLNCRVPSRVELDSLKLLQRNVYSHPTISNALMINVAFRNDASFEQRYPILIIRLTNRTGRLVARRAFRPSEYLDNWQVTDTLAAGKRLDINLAVTDPGNNAHSFELNFSES